MNSFDPKAGVIPSPQEEKRTDSLIRTVRMIHRILTILILIWGIVFFVRGIYSDVSQRLQRSHALETLPVLGDIPVSEIETGKLYYVQDFSLVKSYATETEVQYTKGAGTYSTGGKSYFYLMKYQTGSGKQVVVSLHDAKQLLNDNDKEHLSGYVRCVEETSTALMEYYQKTVSPISKSRIFLEYCASDLAQLKKSEMMPIGFEVFSIVSLAVYALLRMGIAYYLVRFVEKKATIYLLKKRAQ